MRTTITLLLAACLLAACQVSEDEKAAPAVAVIDSLYAHGHYQAALDSIVSLRRHHPRAAKARRHALDIWQKASREQAQQDIARTDSALQATLRELQRGGSIATQNRLRARRDSLRIRFDQLCGIVRVINRRADSARMEHR